MEAGNAVTDLFFTIADKLYAAEATTQFNNVQESLRRSVNDFSLNLQSDPDWKSYQEKGAKFIDEQNQIIDKMATNGHAKQALQQWWMSQRDTLMEKVGQQAWNGRANETVGTATKSINDTMQSVVSGTLSADEGKAKLRVLQDPLVRSNLVDKPTAEANYKDWDHKIDQAAATHGAFALIRQKTADGLPNFQAAHDFLADPKNTAGLSDTEVEQIDNRVTHLETVQDSEDKRANDKLEAPLGDMYSKVMLGDAGLPDFKSIIEQSRGKWVGKEKGERNRKWAGYYEQEVRAEQTAARAVRTERGGYDTDAANNLQTQMYDPEMTKEQKFDLINKSTGITTNDRKKLASSIKNSSTALHDSAERIQGMSAKDSLGNPGPLDAEDVKIGHAMLQEMVDKKPDLTPDQIGKETDTIVEYLSQRKVRDAIKKAFKGMSTELLQAEALTQEPTFTPLEKTAEGMRLQNAIAQEQQTELAGKKITADYVGRDEYNRPIFRDAKGMQFFKGKDAEGRPAWWYQETTIRAGKARSTWLILK
jgi:hypothetical protein